MKTQFAVMLGIALMAKAALGEIIQVPATANPWLAGMTNGATARRGDVAPQESPVAVTNVPITGRAVLVFSASGSVNHGPGFTLYPPDGEGAVASHYFGPENGIADIAVPYTSLIGVFLDSDSPDQTHAPDPLDFETAADRDYSVLTPGLKQPFFIGTGLTSSGAAKQIVAPAGATRLMLGIMDEYGWYDNEGAFTVAVTNIGTASLTKLRLQPSANPTDMDAAATPAISDFDTIVTGPGLNISSIITIIKIVWPSETGRLYQVQWTASLIDPKWENLGPAVSGSGGELSAFDSTKTHPQGFYRVRILPVASGD